VSYALVLNPDPWQWGYLAVQDAHNPDEFAGLMRQAGMREEYLTEHWSVYLERALYGGFLSLRPHPHPWLICIFANDRDRIVRVMAHEVVHLIERLTMREGVPLALESEEVRATLAGRVFGLFFDDFLKRFF